MNIFLMVLLGFVLDLILGDPHSWPHPVKLIGKMISWSVKKIEAKKLNDDQQLRAGTWMWLFIVLATAIISGLIMFISRVNYWLFLIVGTYLAYTTISVKGLAFEAHKIMRSLQKADILTARKQLSMIVGRETDQLNEDEISKATIETIAENINDGVIAPLFYLMIGGPVLGLAYKAVNTLDSMVGYKNARFLNLGRFSAVMDDVFGFIPARLTWLLMIIAAFILRLDHRNAFKIGVRDHLKHNSPNSAYPESVIAGALNIQLGGPHYYFGKLVDKPFIGPSTGKEASNQDIRQTIGVLYVTSVIGLIVLGLVRIGILLIVGNI
ncbi:adenosylcobinamide-phosphate synthase CbiB [Companilactobacillus furfuricola]|uniref:adenosylcobinamide-phosphate synthase CbiB n=1 Tax=Companilactobacillus furfuricola TaxID=1462575 RepID=UPI000F7B9C29|nr:adenosylcobinamide-phosphate synthase CbiB [Companilactobacillus furfuricola]